MIKWEHSIFALPFALCGALLAAGGLPTAPQLGWIELSVGMAPADAWIGVRGSLDLRILLLPAAVTFWVGGFYVLYACQDIDFDRANALNSIPQAYGIRKALLIARMLHLLMLGLLVALVLLFGLGKLAIAGVAAVAILLTYEHSLGSSDDLSKLNAAFFTMNGVIALVFFAFVAADLLLRRYTW